MRQEAAPVREAGELVGDRLPLHLAVEPRIKTSYDVLRYGRWIGNLQNRDQFFAIMDKWVNAVELHKMGVAQAMASCEREENKMIDSYVNNF